MTGWTIPFDPLGAFCRENHTALAATGSGPLDGLTFATKDVMAIEGHRTAFGQPTWYLTHEAATRSAEVVRQCLAAGAHMLGVTLTDELSYSLSGENAHFGTPINPNAPGRIAGGSSSGSAAAVAGGYVDFALGTDCGGSVRLPASYCGILAMRPTHGRVSGEGVLPFAPAFDSVGWFAKDAETLLKVGRVLLDDQNVPPPPKRLLIAKDAFAVVEPRIAHALDDAVAALKGHFEMVEEVTVSPNGFDNWMECFRIIQAAQIWKSMGEWVSQNRPEFGPGIRDRFDIAATVTRMEVAREEGRRKNIIDRLKTLIRRGDVLCLPTSPRIAPLLNTPTDSLEVTYRYQAMALLSIAGHGGLPQINMPLATLDECPLGLSIIGQRGSDVQLMALAQKLMAGR
ncbi:MAG: amidase [Burkholderiales bacterium]